MNPAAGASPFFRRSPRSECSFANLLCQGIERYRGVSRKCKSEIERMSRRDRDVGKNVFVVRYLSVQTLSCMDRNNLDL